MPDRDRTQPERDRLADATELLAESVKQQTRIIERAMDRTEQTEQTVRSERRARRQTTTVIVLALFVVAVLGVIAERRIAATQDQAEADAVTEQFQACERGNEFRRDVVAYGPEIGGETVDVLIEVLIETGLIDPQVPLEDVPDLVREGIAERATPEDGFRLRDCDAILRGEATAPFRRPGGTATTDSAPKVSRPEPTVPPGGFQSCDDAEAAGVGLPVRRGEPGYNRRMDGDGDGVACEAG